MTMKESTNEPMEHITWSDFAKIDLRVGTIVRGEVFHEVKNPAYKMYIDFGTAGIRKTSAQITELYAVEDLVGKQVVAVLNFPPKQIANMQSDCLVLGCIGEGKAVILLTPERKVTNGWKVG